MTQDRILNLSHSSLAKKSCPILVSWQSEKNPFLSQSQGIPWEFYDPQDSQKMSASNLHKDYRTDTGIQVFVLHNVKFQYGSDRQRVLITAWRGFHIQMCEGQLDLVALWNPDVPLLQQVGRVRTGILRRLDLPVRYRLRVGQLPAFTHWQTQNPEIIVHKQRVGAEVLVQSQCKQKKTNTVR